MNLTENWQQILELHNEKAIIPFLKQLDEAQKQYLLPILSKTVKEYLEIKDRLINHKHFYAKKASNKQERILFYSIFVIADNPNLPVHKWLKINILITPFTVENLFNWCCPEWFIEALNKLGEQAFIPLNITYDLVQKMAEKGYFKPSKALIAKLFTRIIFPVLPKEKTIHHFQGDILLERKITLKEHFWYLFEYESQIYNCARVLIFKDKESLPKNSWYFTIQQMATNGKIDRLLLLKAILDTPFKSIFNKRAIGWFIGLFDHLNPSKEELLQLQNSLFQTYPLSYPKAINVALSAIKKIVHLNGFQVDNCFKNFEPLLQSKTKSIVNKALTILEKLASKYPEKRALISVLAAKGLYQKEENLQIKAAKIIRKYGELHSDSLIKTINSFSTNLFQNSLETLKGFPIKSNPQNTDNQLNKFKRYKILTKENQIPNINNFNEFYQLSLQIFDNNQPYHFDQFLSSIIKFQQEIKGENIEKFTPIFKRAYQLVFNELPSHQGMLDNIMAIFLLDLADLLIAKFPAHSQSLKKLAKDYMEQGFFIAQEENAFDLQYAHLYRWYNLYDPSQVYMPVKKLLGAVLTLLHKEKYLPLLSTPSHTPTWLDPIIFIERLAIYQDKKELPDPIDLQIAISRINFDNSEKALKLAPTYLKKEYLKLIQFLLNPKTEFPKNLYQKNKDLASPVEHTTLNNFPFLLYVYVTASITKNTYFRQSYTSQLPDLQIATNYYTGQNEWMVFWEERRFEDWNQKTRRLEFVGKPYIHREIQIKFPKGLDIDKHPDFLYQYFPGNDEAFRPNINDVQRLLGLIPNNPGPLIALLVADNLKYSSFWEVAAKKRVYRTLDWLHQYHHQNSSQPVHLFLAACLLCEDLKIRQSAANFWIKAVQHNNINSVLLGQSIGRMERKNFAPIKRFIDLVQDHLLKISTIHNHALESIIVNILAKLPAIPIKNTKKLLFLYRELLALNHSTINEKRLLILLELWQESPSLKKVILELAVFVPK